MTDEVMSPLRRRMIEDMTIRKLVPKTQQSYIRNVKPFAAFLGRSPGTASIGGFEERLWRSVSITSAEAPLIDAENLFRQPGPTSPCSGSSRSQRNSWGFRENVPVMSATAIGNAVASLENRLGVRSPPTEAVFGDESISPSKLGVDPGHAPSTQDRTSFATASLLLSIIIMWPLPLTPRSPKNQKSALAPFSFSQSPIRTSRWLRRSQAAA
jgi:hypothetical protein